MKTFLLMLSGLCISGFFFVQNKTVLQGTITDESQEQLIGASIRISQNSVLVKGTVTDYEGRYNVELAPGTYDIEVSSVGFTTLKKSGVQVLEGQVNTFDGVLSNSTEMMSETILAYSTAAPRQTSALPKVPAGSRSSVKYTPPAMAKKSGRAVKRKDKNEAEQVIELEEKMDQPSNDESPERYDQIIENQFVQPSNTPVSTFSIDVDGASYANARRFLAEGQLPPRDAVRVEEFVNYFDYQYKAPTDGKPFAVYTELAKCPWSPEHRLLSIALQGREIETGQLPPSNFVFLVDVSGSMNDANKLPLVQSSLMMLTDYLRPQDRVALVTYAGAAGLVLASTPGNQKEKIKAAIESLGAGGSTAGAAGIQLAYQTARSNFAAHGNNRVILCTDGDFNVGMNSDEDLVKLIEKERESGIYLSILGFGMGNYQDGKMQKLADKGNGNHSYIDQLAEAKKVLISEFGGTLFAIAKDVKIQIEFNADKVAAYRLIGYENRLLAREDFDDDTKDAGELGAGHRVTALYEIIPAGQDVPLADEKGDLQYQKTKPSAGSKNDDLLTLRLRYKQPKPGAASELIQTAVSDKPTDKMSENLTLAAAAASFGLVLRNSTYKGSATLTSALSLAESAAKNDRFGYRTELCKLIRQANKKREVRSER